MAFSIVIYNTDSSPRIVAEMACSLDMGKYIVDFLTILAYNKGENCAASFSKEQQQEVVK